jgi:hypothetical protein
MMGVWTGCWAAAPSRPVPVRLLAGQLAGARTGCVQRPQRVTVDAGGKAGHPDRASIAQLGVCVEEFGRFDGHPFPVTAAACGAGLCARSCRAPRHRRKRARRPRTRPPTCSNMRPQSPWLKLQGVHCQLEVQTPTASGDARPSPSIEASSKALRPAQRFTCTAGVSSGRASLKELRPGSIVPERKRNPAHYQWRVAVGDGAVLVQTVGGVGAVGERLRRAVVAPAVMST